MKNRIATIIDSLHNYYLLLIRKENPVKKTKLRELLEVQKELLCFDLEKVSNSALIAKINKKINITEAQFSNNERIQALHLEINMVLKNICDHEKELVKSAAALYDQEFTALTYQLYLNWWSHSEKVPKHTRINILDNFFMMHLYCVSFDSKASDFYREMQIYQKVSDEFFSIFSIESLTKGVGSGGEGASDETSTVLKQLTPGVSYADRNKCKSKMSLFFSPEEISTMHDKRPYYKKFILVASSCEGMGLNTHYENIFIDVLETAINHNIALDGYCFYRIILFVNHSEKKVTNEFWVLVLKLLPNFINEYKTKCSEIENFIAQGRYQAVKEGDLDWVFNVSNALMILLNELTNQATKTEKIAFSEITATFKTLKKVNLHVFLWRCYLDYYIEDKALCNKSYTALRFFSENVLIKDNLSVLMNPLITSVTEYAQRSGEVKKLLNEKSDFQRAHELFLLLVLNPGSHNKKMDPESSGELELKSKIYVKMMYALLTYDEADIDVVQPLLNQISPEIISGNELLMKLLFNAISRKEKLSVKEIQSYLSVDFWECVSASKNLDSEHHEYKMTRFLEHLFSQVKTEMAIDASALIECQTFFANHLDTIVAFPQRLNSLCSNFTPKEATQFCNASPCSTQASKTLQNEIELHRVYLLRKEEIIVFLNKTLLALHTQLSNHLSKLFTQHVQSLKELEGSFFPSEQLDYLCILRKEYSLFLDLAYQDVKGFYTIAKSYFDRIIKTLSEHDLCQLQQQSKMLRDELQAKMETQIERNRVENEQNEISNYKKTTRLQVRQFVLCKMFDHCEKIEQHYTVNEMKPDNFDEYLVKIELLSIAKKGADVLEWIDKVYTKFAHSKKYNAREWNYLTVKKYRWLIELNRTEDANNLYENEKRTDTKHLMSYFWCLRATKLGVPKDQIQVRIQSLIKEEFFARPSPRSAHLLMNLKLLMKKLSKSNDVNLGEFIPLISESKCSSLNDQTEISHRVEFVLDNEKRSDNILSKLFKSSDNNKHLSSYEFLQNVMLQLNTNPYDTDKIVRVSLQDLNDLNFSENKHIVKLLDEFAKRVKNSSGQWTPEDLSMGFYCLQRMTGKRPEEQALLMALRDKLKNSVVPFRGSAIAKTFYGLKKMSSDLSVVRSILQLLVDKLRNCQVVLNSKSILSILCGLQSMSSDCLVVRDVLGVLVDKIKYSNEVFNEQACGIAWYCLRRMSTEYVEVRDVLQILTTKIKASPANLTEQGIVCALYGLKNKSSHYPVVRTYLEVIAEKIESSFDAKLNERGTMSILKSLSKIGSHYTETKTLLLAVSTKIKQSQVKLTNSDYDEAMSHLKQMAHCQEVEVLISALSRKGVEEAVVHTVQPASLSGFFSHPKKRIEGLAATFYTACLNFCVFVDGYKRKQEYLQEIKDLLPSLTEDDLNWIPPEAHRTALHQACFYGDKILIKILIENNVNVDLKTTNKDKQQLTALEIAKGSVRTYLAELITEREESLRSKSEESIMYL